MEYTNYVPLADGKTPLQGSYLKSSNNKLLKQGIWAYFLLVIFEGALRKWFLPGLATPLLVVRDPIAIWLVYSSWKRGLLPSNIYIMGIFLIGLIGIYTAIFIGHGNFYVAMFGARIYLFHLPLMLVIGAIFDRSDILKIGEVTLYMALPMAILIYLQFKSPQSAWVNRGIGGDMAGAGFSGVGDFLRPPATFSFTNGTTLYFSWLAPFVFYFWLNANKIKKWVLISATLGLLIAIPLSISRSLLFGVIITLAFTLFATFRKPEYFGKMIIAIIVGVIALGILSQTSFFSIATGAFTERFTSANEQEGGVVKGVIGDRLLGGLLSSLSGSTSQPFFGQGLGMGTNVGSILLAGKQIFLISETPWGQIIGELGPLMGITVIILRIGLTLKVTRESYLNLIIGDSLPWILLSFGFVNILIGGLSQPTSLGFVVISGGILLASVKNEKKQMFQKR